MKFQINNGWLIGAVFIPASTILAYGDKPDEQLTEFEKLAKDRPLPIDCCPLDADAAISLWRTYPFDRHRLHLNKLDQLNAETFEKLKGMDYQTMERLWATKG